MELKDFLGKYKLDDPLLKPVGGRYIDGEYIIRNFVNDLYLEFTSRYSSFQSSEMNLNLFFKIYDEVDELLVKINKLTYLGLPYKIHEEYSEMMEILAQTYYPPLYNQLKIFKNNDKYELLDYLKPYGINFQNFRSKLTCKTELPRIVILAMTYLDKLVEQDDLRYNNHRRSQSNHESDFDFNELFDRLFGSRSSYQSDFSYFFNGNQFFTQSSQRSNSKLDEYLKILGLNSDANANQVKEAWRKLCFKYHPDSSNKDDADMFIKITEAKDYCLKYL